VFKSFVIGMMVGVLLLVGGVYYYFVSGMAPVAAGDPPWPYEKKDGEQIPGCAHCERKSPRRRFKPTRKTCLPVRRFIRKIVPFATVCPISLRLRLRIACIPMQP